MSVLDALPPPPLREAMPLKPPPLPPIAVCVRLSVPLVAPPIASFTPPLLIRLTDAPLPLWFWALPPLPPIAVPDMVTVPPVAELPKTAGPRPPLDRVAEPPLPPGPERATWLPGPPLPPLAMADTAASWRATPLAWAFALPPLPPVQLPLEPQPPPPPNPPLAVAEIDALGTLITIAFEDALPPAPPTVPVPPVPPVPVAVAKPVPVASAALVAAVAAAGIGRPPFQISASARAFLQNMD
jgi:hypothetical protein